MPAKSKAQQKLMGAALACKRGKGPCKGGAAKVAKSMTKKELKKYASTPTKRLPAKAPKRKK
jgi:hypothetical protein